MPKDEKYEDCRLAAAACLVLLALLGLLFLPEADKRRAGAEKAYFTIRYHSNYPTGEDRIYEVIYEETGNTEREGGFAEQFASYPSCGFCGWLPRSDCRSWYLDKDCRILVQRLYPASGGVYDLYAGWR